MDKRYGPTAIECTEYGYGDTMITANHNRQCSPVQDSLHCCFCEALVSFDISWISGFVSTVDDSNIASTEQRASQIKIPMCQTVAESDRFRAYSRKRVRLIISNLVHSYNGNPNKFFEFMPLF